MFLRRPRPNTPSSGLDPADPNPTSTPSETERLAHAHQAIRTIGIESSKLGHDAADLRGIIEDTQQAAIKQLESYNSLAAQMSEVNRAQGSISAATQDSTSAVGRARDSVTAVGQEVQAIVDTLRSVSEAAGQITQIALQTRLVAFNASVEAKRAGEAGRGFGVVAEAVKDLSAKVESSSKEIMGTMAQLDARIESLAREIMAAPAGQPPSTFQRALGDVEQTVVGIAAAARQSQAICEGVNQHVGILQRDTRLTQDSLDAAKVRAEGFLRISEQLIDHIAGCGIDTEDTPYIRAVQDAAQQVSRLLENAVRVGEISERDLFDEAYQPVAGSNPAQHLARFNALTDRLLPQVQERVLGMTTKVVFCASSDRNGYIPTHNKIYCQPQGSDPVWNAANSRWRRIFADRTGLASSRNTRPFLLQTYRRDMGGGKYVLLKEAAAPITVNGRHWGGIRLAFRF